MSRPFRGDKKRFMKLGFEETQAAYSSGSQNARTWTEQWVRAQVYCPNCGAEAIKPFPNNSPLADFHCITCSEEYELKSQRNKFSNKCSTANSKPNVSDWLRTIIQIYFC